MSFRKHGNIPIEPPQEALDKIRFQYYTESRNSAWRELTFRLLLVILETVQKQCRNGAVCVAFCDATALEAAFIIHIVLTAAKCEENHE